MRRTAIVVRFLVAATLVPLVLDSITHRAVRAAIVVTGDSSPAYDNSDPWAPDSLIIGDTAPGNMTISAGSVVNNTGDATIANTSAASTSSVSVAGAGSTWTNSNFLHVGVLGTGTLDITDGGSISGNGTFIGDGIGGIGNVTVGGGTGASALNMTGSMAVGSVGTGTLDITGGGAVSDFNGFLGYTYPTSIGTVTVGGGTGSATWTNSGTLYLGVFGTGTLNINTGGIASTSALYVGNATSSVNFAGGTLSITATGTIAGSGSAANTINLLTGGGTFDIPTAADTFTITNSINGVGSLTKTGAGTLTLSSTNAYSGGTTVSAGTLSIGNASSAGSVSGDITNNGTVQFNRSNNITYTGQISGTGAVVQQGIGTLTLTANGTYTGTTTINHGALSIGNGGTTGSIAGDITNNQSLHFNRSDNVTYAGVISGTGVVAKEGAGTLTLTGANPYSGTTTISAGTLSIGNGGTTGSIDSIAHGIANNASLVFNRSDAVTYAGVISGSGTMTKNGAGTLTLTGANTYTGLTTISAGALSIGNGGTTGSIARGVTNNAALIFNRSDDVTYTSQISGTGAITKLANGILTLSGNNSYSGGTTVSVGTLLANNTTGSATGSADVLVDSSATLAIGSGSSVGSVSGNITDNGAVQFNRSNTITYAGQISGTGTVANQGNGTLILSSANTYSGDTTVSAGTLLANNATGSATGSGNITVGPFGATLGGTGAVAGNVTVNGMLAPGAGIESLGMGSLNFNAGSTFKYEISSSPPSADLVNVNGDLTIVSALVNLSDLGTASVTPGTKFTLISYAGNWSGGTFVNRANNSLVNVGANTYQINYNDTQGGVNFGGGEYSHFVTLTTMIPGDFNADQKVDAADYVYWRKTGGTAADYQKWRANFGKSSPGLGSGMSPIGSSVPEPSPILLLLLGLAATNQCVRCSFAQKRSRKYQ